MGSSDAPNCRYSDEEIKSKLVARLFLPIKKHGIANLRTDDIAKYMDLSKATLYKYFESKDDVLTHVVELFKKHFVVMDAILESSSATYQERYQVVFQKMLLAANYGSEPLRNDLRALYPDLMESIQVAVSVRNDRLRHFYEQGMEEGVFIAANADLLILQDDLCFARLVDPLVLMARNLTCRQALFDYYHLRIHQIFTPESCPSADDDAIVKKLEALAQKISSGMM